MRHRVLDTDSITVPEYRQRQKFQNIEALADSIKRHGLLQPIIVDDGFNLIAGERRLRACLLIGLRKVPVRLASDLSSFERLEIEFEENIRREDLTWQEECLAILHYHDIHIKHENKWTVAKTADRLGCSTKSITRKIHVGRAVEEGDTKVLACDSVSSAYNAVERKNRRAVDEEVSQFFDTKITVTDTEEKQSDSAVFGGVKCCDFFTEIDSYTGPKFNFIHLDPPYGINHHTSQQGASVIHGAYRDDEEIYYAFLRKVFSPSFFKHVSTKAHIMWWLSMNHYSVTKEIIQEFYHANRDLHLVLNDFPLIWYKSDSTGILPDPNRGPRRVYETAIHISIGDRRVVESVNNVAAVAANKRYAKHLSEKPKEMLFKFFRMFVDEHTKMLDPCCGAGSSLAAAVALRAKSVVGWDLNSDYIEIAQNALNKALTESGKILK